MIGTADAIRDLIVTELNWSGDRTQLTDDFPLLDNAVIDSLGIFQVVSFLEDKWGVEIEDHELVPENFESLGAIARLVERKAGE